MATWSFSGYKNGRGADVTLTYTAAYNAATNKTTVRITNYTAVFNTGGSSGACALTGTLTVSAADNTSSAGTFEISASKSGVSPTISTDVTKTIDVSHGVGMSKKIILSFSGDINANYYHSYPEESTTVSVYTASAYTLSVSAGEGTKITVNRTASNFVSTGYLANGASVYANDKLTITIEALSGLELETNTVNNADFTSGGVHTVTGNVAIVATAKRLGLIYIFVASYTGLELYIHNGTNFIQLAPYIHNGTSWVQLS